MKPKYRLLSSQSSLNARSLREIRRVMTAAVRDVREDDEIRFRGRPFNNEAFINAAVWHLAEMSRAQQEKVLRAYLPRIESYLLITGGESEPAAGPVVGDDFAAPPPPEPTRERKAGGR